MATWLPPRGRCSLFTLSFLWICIYVFTQTRHFLSSMGIPLHSSAYPFENVETGRRQFPLNSSQYGKLRFFDCRENVLEGKPQYRCGSSYAGVRLAFLGSTQRVNALTVFRCHTPSELSPLNRRRCYHSPTTNSIFRNGRRDCIYYRARNIKVLPAKATQRHGNLNDDGEDGNANHTNPNFDVQRALKLIEETMPDSHDSPEGSNRSEMATSSRMTVLYNCFLHGCERQGDILAAIELFQHMLRKKVKPDAPTFRSLAALLERSGQYIAFLQLLDQMLAHDIPPPIEVLSLGISCCCKAGAANEALILAQRLKDCLCEINIVNSQSAVPPIDVAVPSEAVPPALSTSFTVLAHAMPAVVYSNLITCLARTGRHEEALNLYEQLLGMANHQDKLRHFLSLKNMHMDLMSSEMKELRQALTPQSEHYAMQLLARDDFQPSVACSNAALASAAATGRLQASLRIFKLMLQYQNDRSSISLPPEGISGSGQYSLVESSSPTTETFLLMLQAAGFQGNSEAVRFIVSHFEHQQDKRRSMQLRPLDESAFWAAVSKNLAMCGRWSEAVGMLVRAHSVFYVHQDKAHLDPEYSASKDHTGASSKDPGVLLEMQHSAMLGVEPYLAVLRACADAGAARESLGILRLLQQRHRHRQNTRRFTGNVIQDGIALREEFPLSAYEEVLRAADKASDWEMVLSVASEFESPKAQELNPLLSSTPCLEEHLDKKRSMQGTTALSAAAGCTREAPSNVRVASHINMWSSPLLLRIRVQAFKLIAVLKLERLSTAQKELDELYRLLEQEQSFVSSLRISVTPEVTGFAMGSQETTAPMWHPQSHSGVVKEALVLASRVLRQQQAVQPSSAV